MKTKKTLYIIVLAVTFCCTSVSEEDLIDTTPVPMTVTYEANIKTIINTNCIICHNNPPVNGAPITLVTYNDVKNAVENNGLISRISSNDLSFLMPFGGPRLPQSTIDLIIQWETDGLLEE
ncbi:hypothetical protein [Psychroserpens sp. SPM9]|uniref:hypothetical protein n=1 Tax=Psychroserpens sp. SPM9 TaxID=2975598 RepID=UPI0021A404E7|nr:hypothetical protein [Psychroserpens sp. SPM9]MDG5492117.1 hypothetical protein [Psychroserpens sp. SPM9]